MSEYTIRPVEDDADYKFGVKLLNAWFGKYLGLNHEIAQIRDQWQRRDNPLRRSFIAEIDGKPIAAMGYNEMPSNDGRRHFFLNILIMPEHHSAALLNDLFTHLYERVAEHNPDELKMSLDDFLEDHISLAEAQGFERIQRDNLSSLRLSKMDFNTLANLVTRVEASGIRFVTLPEYEHENPQCKAAIVELTNMIYRDVPGFESAFATMELFEERVFQNPQILRDAWILALDGDQLVGMTYITRFGNDEDCLTRLTGVIRSHRRRGITTAMKVKAFEILREMGFKRILTSNEENNPMYQINLKFGFEPGPSMFHYAKQVTDV